MKVVTIIGARPQFIKCAAVSRELRHVACEILVHTGQHYDKNLSDVFFQELQIPQPDYHLGVGSGAHGKQTAEMLRGIEDVLFKEHPNWVLVYGDTNSTLAGALAAAKLCIPVAHVEAGLRSFNRRMPEEINRVLTDHISTLLLAPCQTAVDNLRREGLAESSIREVGDVMYDAILNYRDVAQHKSRILSTLSLKPKTYVLATIHRAENTADPVRLSVIWNAIHSLAQRMHTIVPLHPRTRLAFEGSGLCLQDSPQLQFINPLGYLDMIALQTHAQLVVTDSGGVQKEAFFCRTPCVTLRDETEWVELLAQGWNRLAPPTDLSSVLQILDDALQWIPPAEPQSNPYGTGEAVHKIVAELLEYAVPKNAL